MKIIAIDPGTKCGYATGFEAGEFGCRDLSPLTAAPRKGRSPEPEFARCGKLWELLRDLAQPPVPSPFTVVCEGAAGFMKGKAAVRVSNELRGAVKAWCWANGARYLEIQPHDLKRFAIGKSTADKAEMVRAARERFGYEGANDNEADALWLLAWARQHVAGGAA